MLEETDQQPRMRNKFSAMPFDVMTMAVRTNELRLRRRRHEHAGYRMDRPRAADVVQQEAPTPGPRRRHGGPSQDQALYTCQCGLAFDAAVSTSVDCPHCGLTQAW
jgi:hypothetical protein